MFKAEDMTKVRISGTKSVQREVVYELYDLKLLELIGYKKKEKDFFDIGKPFDNAENYSALILKIRAIINQLNLKGKTKTIKLDEKTIKKINALYLEFTEKSNKLKETENQLKKLKEDLSQKTLILGITEEMQEKMKNISVIIGTSMKDLEKEIKSKLKSVYVIKKNTGKEFVFAFFVMKKQENELTEILKQKEFSREKLPAETMEKLKERLEKSEKEKIILENYLNEFKNKNSEFLLNTEKTLSEEIKKLEAPLNFASTKNAFLIKGWIPTKKLNELEKRLNKKTKGKILIERFKEKKGMPIALNNPKQLKPFEFFLNLYTLPKYYELDPTIITAITFPLFFGFMLGDIGYGLTILSLLIIAKKFIKQGQLKALINIMVIASIATIVFGFVFGEFFGFYITEHPLLHRAHEINLMLIITVLIGAIHVNLGFILGFINKYWEHGLKHAILEKASWIFIEIGVVLLFLNYSIIGGIISVASLLMLVKGDGARGLIELPSVLSNILSYTRLFAIGLASVELAEIINELAMPLFHSGNILFILMGIMVLLLGHALNLFLGVLGPFIQSLRLHYVEFYTKFFEGGGKEFKPFGL